MTIKITPLGGIKESGRNCVAVHINDKIIICDMGFHLERFISVTEDDFPHRSHLMRALLDEQAIPSRKWLQQHRDNIVGVCISHAHLDHVGAIPFLIKSLNCPIYATKFAANLIRNLCEQKRVRPKIIQVKPGATVKVRGIPVEFIRLSHSTPEACSLAIHSSEGIVLYANDYKNDQTPPFGQKTDVERLKALRGKVKVMILDTLYGYAKGHSSSEAEARKAVLSLQHELQDKRAIVFSTFSSHLHRLRSILDLTNRLGREPVFVGRSLSNYLDAGGHIFPQAKDSRQLKYRRQVDHFLRTVNDPERYVLIVTGHQGEPNAVLSRMAEGMFHWQKNDIVVFSCTTIPSPLTIKNRKILEEKLDKQGVPYLKDVHVSGHGHLAEQEDIIRWIMPPYVLPAHAEPPGEAGAREMIAKIDGVEAINVKLLDTFTA